MRPLQLGTALVLRFRSADGDPRNGRLLMADRVVTHNTAVINCVQEAMLARSAVFTASKFDLLRRTGSAFCVAFDQLFAHLQARAHSQPSSGNALDGWKAQLRSNLTPRQLRSLIAVMPNLAVLLGVVREDESTQHEADQRR